MTDPTTRLNAALEGRYRIERELGEGGMATVYLAQDLKHERRVALKVLKPELAAAIGAERFLTEIRTTANLQHPHILPLHDSGEADGLLFYVMPYVDGESLRERLDREHQLPVAVAVRIATHVAEALDFAHRHGVIHRDIKPANILLVDDQPVIADFGIALALDSDASPRLTDTSMSIGTPTYMSPEQGLEGARVDRRSDIYSLGCVLYEMLVGDPPFTGSNSMAVLVRKSTEAAPDIRAVRETVSTALEAVVLKALARVPADRHATAGELARSLAGLEASRRMESAEVEAAGSRATSPGLLTRKRSLAFLSGVVVLLLAWQFISGPSASATRAGIEGLAMMPLESFGGVEADLVGGLHAEMIAEMQRFERPQTRSRHSVARLAAQQLALPEVGTELGVEAVTTGFVRLERDTLSLRLSMMQVRPVEAHLWSGDFSAPVAEAYELVDPAVLALADELAVDLTPEQAARLRAPVELAPEAQTLYQRARALLERLDQEDVLRDAIVLLDSASAIEPGFAEALAWESMVHSWMWWWQFDQTDGRLAVATARADSALSLSRAVPEPHMAKGFIYSVQAEVDEAMARYEPAYALKPNDPELNLLMGMAIRDQGDFARGAEHLVRGATLDPTSSIRTVEAAYTLMALRDWDRVLEMVELAEAATPIDPWASLLRARVYLERDDGDPARAVEVFGPDVRARGAGPYVSPDLLLPLYLASLDESVAEPFFADSLSAGFHDSPGRLEMTRGVILWNRGDTIAARGQFELAVAAVAPLVAGDGATGRLRSELLGNLGIALAALDRWSEAPEVVVEWLNSEPVSSDKYGAANARARIWALLGDTDAAVADLERRLSQPDLWASPTLLRVDPWFDSIRSAPAFQALLEGA